MEYRTEQMILCGFYYCHEKKKEYFSEMFYRFLEENLKKLNNNALWVIYANITNQDKTWLEIKEIIMQEIMERKNV